MVTQSISQLDDIKLKLFFGVAYFFIKDIYVLFHILTHYFLKYQHLFGLQCPVHVQLSPYFFNVIFIFNS